jgi:hypothetical protein
MPLHPPDPPPLAPTPPTLRNEQHRCAHCGSRFEVWHRADTLETYVDVEVQCPCCHAATSLSLPRGAEKDLRVENLPGPEPETGTVD